MLPSSFFGAPDLHIGCGACVRIVKRLFASFEGRLLCVAIVLVCAWHRYSHDLSSSPQNFLEAMK